MEILKNIEQNTPEWLEARKGKITGSKLKDIVVLRGTGKKIGFYQLMADRLAIEEEREDPMERGHRLEPEAIEAFEKEIGKTTTEVGLCVSDENPNIAVSYDRLLGKTESVEAKCLGTAKHLQAYFEQDWSEFKFQIYQGFIVNDKLKKQYLVFFDPRVTAKPLHWIEINRKDVEKEIETYKEYQIETLKEIDILLEKIAF